MVEDPEKKIIHHPEFVEEEETPSFEMPSPEMFSKEDFPPIPWRVRLISFTIGIVALFWTFGAAVMFCLTIAACAITLFQVEIINRLAAEFWQSVRTGSVVTLALFVALFSPYLGLTALFAYFLIGEAEGRQGMIAKFLRSTFGDYMNR